MDGAPALVADGAFVERDWFRCGVARGETGEEGADWEEEGESERGEESGEDGAEKIEKLHCHLPAHVKKDQNVAFLYYKSIEIILIQKEKKESDQRFFGDENFLELDIYP